ncbi:MAG: hypothetical protein IKJ82_08795 [Oscillospiraceae bacterium]|nr:hypothetical protein [Oscillospiraceae bacterium]
MNESVGSFNKIVKAEDKIVNFGDFTKILAKLCQKKCPTGKENICDECEFYRIYEEIDKIAKVKGRGKLEPCGVCGSFPKVEIKLIEETKFKYGEHPGDTEVEISCSEEHPERKVSATAPTKERAFETAESMWNELAVFDLRRRAKEAEHRAEVFERMAFKLQEERELLIWFLRKVCNGTWFCDCDGCANGEQFGACGDIDKSCRGCEREGTCPCGTCERGSNLVFDSERAKKLWEEDERRKKK